MKKMDFAFSLVLLFNNCVKAGILPISVRLPEAVRKIKVSLELSTSKYRCVILVVLSSSANICKSTQD